MSAPDLNLCLLQADTVWHDPQANRDYYTGLLAAQAGDADIIILPETFTSGFSNEALAQAETMDGATVQWLRAQAIALNAAITGSVQIRDGGRVFNRLLWATPDGQLQYYDKRHLFRMAGEHERYAAGTDKTIVEFKGWRICPLVCYDLRFPVFSRNRFAKANAHGYDYDLLIFVANWPSARHYAWQSLLKARAIENLCYLAAVNRVGTDGNGLEYAGGSTVLDFLGQPMLEAGGSPQALQARLGYAELNAFRARFPAHLDADDFEIK
jgi:omega-amidase